MDWTCPPPPSRRIKDNYHRPLTLTEIAAFVGLSTFHFLRVFKAATGQTPYRYLNGVRVERARRYLERDELSVTEITYLCGFATPSRLVTLSHSVEQAAPIPARLCWERKALAHAETVGMLGEMTDDPALAQVADHAAGLTYDLAVAAGPIADWIIRNSRRRLLSHLRTGDADAARGLFFFSIMWGFE